MKRNLKISIKAVTGITIAVFLLAGMAGISTWAYFSDVETSTNNVLAAGTLDLKTDDVDGVSQTLLASNMVPGETIGPETIVLKNAGSLSSSSLDIDFTYINNDSAKNPVDMSADATAAQIEVTKLNYNQTSILGSVSDTNVNGYRDIQDLKNSNLSNLAGISSSSTKNFEIEIKARSSIHSNFQADGIVITITFSMNQ